MDNIEALRAELHKAIESGNTKRTLEISKQLDKLIYYYMQAINKSAPAVK